MTLSEKLPKGASLDDAVDLAKPAREERKIDHGRVVKNPEGPQRSPRTTKAKPTSSHIVPSLTDSVSQRGVSWRAGKIEAIITARNDGMTDEAVFRTMLRAGITKEKIRELMQTASDAEGGE